MNEISDFTSAERHHIFPKKFLSGHGPAGAEVHAVANFCFLPAELNRAILDKAPAAYVAELRETNPNFENAVHTHCATVREQRDLTGRAAAQLTRCAL